MHLCSDPLWEKSQTIIPYKRFQLLVFTVPALSADGNLILMLLRTSPAADSAQT